MLKKLGLIPLILLLGIFYSNPVMAQICQCGFDDGQFTLINTTMDGNMNEWDPVINDIDNNACDGTGQGEDRDYEVQSTGRDLQQFAFTWDNTYLSAYTRRYASSKNNNKFIYYADTNTDGLMSTGEPVVVVFWKGSNRNVELFVGTYEADAPSGDPLVDNEGFADGYAMPGELNGNLTGKGLYSGNWGSSSGTVMEWRVKWSDLGVPAGTAISWHVSTTNSQPGSNNISDQIDDNLGGCGGGAGGTQYADINFAQSTNDSLLKGSTVYLPHEITNNGNIQDTLDFELTSSGDFSVSSVQYYQDLGTVGTYESGTDILLTDTDGDGFPDTGDMDPEESKSILIKAVLPSAPADGTAILTTEATSNFIPGSDPTARITDTVKDTLTLLHKVEGIVFEDITGDALTDGDFNLNDNAGDQQRLQNVQVMLFKDGGDGLADGNDDILLGETTTNANGEYSFTTVSNDYWVAVNSRSGELSSGTSWAEQTYGPANAVCTDGTGNAVIQSTAGPCYGGRRATQSDNLSSNNLGGAEHVIQLQVSQTDEIENNFGFSFNVVTNLSDGDDDGSNPRTIQGSLRQFIQNANVIAAANQMRFVPVVATNASSGSGNWWNIDIASILPTLTDAQTTIDGTAYAHTNPQTQIDSNSGLVGTGGTVGTDNLGLNRFGLPELEINLADAGALRINSSGTFTIRNLAMYNNQHAINLLQTSGGIIEQNLLGTRADGSEPASTETTETTIFLGSTSAVSATIQQNYIAFATTAGLKSNNPNAVLAVNQNEFYKNNSVDSQGSGLEGAGQWTIQENLIHQNGNNNSDAISGGSGVQLGSSSNSSQNNTIRNNTITNNTVSGITTLNSVTNTDIEQNIISENGTNYNSSNPKLGAGILLTIPNQQSQDGILISQNSFTDNYGLAVDIVEDYSGSGQADGVNVNDGTTTAASSVPNKALDYPVITSASLGSGTLNIEGYVGTVGNKLQGSFTIEFYKAADDGNNDGLTETGSKQLKPHGEGVKYIGSITTNADGTFDKEISVGGSITLASGDPITALTIDGNNNTSEFGSNKQIVNAGTTVKGYVFDDVNHNGNKENDESGIASVAVTLYSSQSNSCKSVLTDGNGFYEFNSVSDGDYQLIESSGTNTPTPTNCAPGENDPDGYISTTNNNFSITVEGEPISKNFGDFEGAKIEGQTFNDNGVNGGIANDIIKNGGEKGIGGTTIQALDSNGNLITEQSSTADGKFVFYIDKSSITDGSAISIKEVNKGSFFTIGGNAGTTAGSYNTASDAVSFTFTSGNNYSGILFSNVLPNRLLTDGQKVLKPGASGLFTHTYQAQTEGTVTFSTASVNNPSTLSWPVILYNDTNNNGAVDSGEPILDSSTQINVTTGQKVNLLLKVSVPLAAQNGANSSTTVKADFTLANTTTPSIIKTQSRTDLVKVSKTTGGLEIAKSVDKPQALPGAVLTYTISYTNNGDKPISSLEIVDDIPAYTEYVDANYGQLPNNLSDCIISAPSTGSAGNITWTFDGTLQPGESGAVTYQVQISN